MRIANAHTPGPQRLDLVFSGLMVEKPEDLHPNLSPDSSSGLEAAAAADAARRWQAQSLVFFDWYNVNVEKHGLLLAEYRQF